MQLALPEAATPVAKFPLLHWLGLEASAVAYCAVRPVAVPPRFRKLKGMVLLAE
jgi:hypothetical protein